VQHFDSVGGARNWLEREQRRGGHNRREYFLEHSASPATVPNANGGDIRIDDHRGSRLIRERVGGARRGAQPLPDVRPFDRSRVQSQLGRLVS
jgi:hypothetical protein